MPSFKGGGSKVVDGRCQTITALENERVCSFLREVGDGGGGDPSWMANRNHPQKRTRMFFFEGSGRW